MENVGVAEYTGKLINNELSNATLNTVGKGIYQTTMPEPSNPVTSSTTIDVNGYQISMKAEGIRTIYTVDSPDNDVECVGLIYGMTGLATEEDMVCESENSNVFSYEATEQGKSDKNLGKKDSTTTYVMTMQFDTTSVEYFTSRFLVRAYARLKDGTYVYGGVHDYCVYDVADWLYQKASSSNGSAHDYLYNNILKRVSADYKKIDYDWANTIVPVR